MGAIVRVILNYARKMLFPETYSQEAYIMALRDKYHVDIGHNCRIYSPNQTYIDKQRGHMLHIGNYCKITRNVTILTHDYSRGVCCNISGGGTGMLAKRRIRLLEIMFSSGLTQQY